MPITEPDATDLLHLFRRHPEFETKLGTGIDYFTIRPTLFDARAFEAVRSDNSRTEFSYKKCLEPTPSLQRELLAALRVEIEADILFKKEEYFSEHGDLLGRIPCRVTSELITIGECQPIMRRPILLGPWRRSLLPLAPVISGTVLRCLLRGPAIHTANSWQIASWPRTGADTTRMLKFASSARMRTSPAPAPAYRTQKTGSSYSMTCYRSAHDPAARAEAHTKIGELT